MKTIFTFFLSLSTLFCFAQDFYFHFGGLTTAPIFNFYNSNYSIGAGVQGGLSLNQKINQKWSLGIGYNGVYSANGNKTADLSLGEYTLYNSFTNDQMFLNGYYHIGNIGLYGGLHIGRAGYKTREQLNFSETQDDGSEYYDADLYKTRVFQYGGQVGGFVQLSPAWQFFCGASLLKSDQKVKFIDFESYVYDGEEINYQEPKSSPFLFTANFGFKVNLSLLARNAEVNSSTSNSNVSTPVYYNTRRNNGYSSCSGNQTVNRTSTTTTSTKKKSKPKLYKNGKTPIMYK